MSAEGEILTSIYGQISIEIYAGYDLRGLCEQRDLNPGLLVILEYYQGLDGIYVISDWWDHPSTKGKFHCPHDIRPCRIVHPVPLTRFEFKTSYIIRICDIVLHSNVKITDLGNLYR